MDARVIIERLGLKPLAVEGGYFRETYRGEETIPADALPNRYGGERAFLTAIYYLLTPDTFSEIHRLASCEIFHFYMGDPVEMLLLRPDGSHSVITIGTDLEAGQVPQVVVPAGVWQGSRLKEGGAYALMGTTVAPAFDYADYESGDRASLISQYPACANLITALTGG